jgi:hypothetical protein
MRCEDSSECLRRDAAVADLLALSTSREAPVWPLGARKPGRGGPPDTYGELGIRHEDTVVATEQGCENLAPKWSGTPEEPAAV